MIEHYNAFISYKHAPLDTKVAAEIQKQLERFRIPKAIQKSSGIKCIDRIFRDKEELLITSDLNETIEQALVASDFLIVICSHATKESVWVQREIEFFLKTHSKNQILTVVAEGEPVDVVPQILREQEVTVTLDSGEEETVIMPIEPLSCDYRGDFRKARKEELPRLAATILGCSYDELKRRQRQYRMRRTIAAFSAVAVLLAALSVYYAWSASQIKENYLQSLRNQSQYLSSESLALLDQGDRFNAMLLALEALPKDEEDERPVLPEAEYALAKAVNAYASANENQYTAEYAFHHGGEINKIMTLQEETRLVVLHSDYNFALWDVESREKITEQVMPNIITDSAISFDNNLLLLCYNTVYCYNAVTGEPLWQLDTYEYKDTAYGTDVIIVSETAPMAAVRMGDYLVTLDTATGQVLWDIPLPTFEKDYSWSEETVWCSDILYGTFSPDNKTLFLHLSSENTYLALCDLETGVFTITDFWFWSVEDAFFTDSGNVVLMGKFRIRNGNYWIKPLYYYEDDYTEIACINPEGQMLWADEIHYTEMDVGLGSECTPFLYPGEDGDIGAVAAVAGERLHFYDIETGELLEENYYTDSIVTLTAREPHLSAILTNGMIGQYSFAEKRNMAGDFCIDGIDLAADQDTLENSWLFVSNSETGTVLLYTYGLHDDNWIQMPVEGQIIHDTYTSFRKNRIANTTLLTNGTYLYKPFVVLNGETLTARYYEGLSKEFMDGKHMVGLSSDGKKILIQDYYGENSAAVAAFDLETEEYIPEYYTLPTGWNNLYILDDIFYYASYISDENNQVFDGIVRQIPDGTYETVIIPTVDAEASLWGDTLVATHQGEDAILVRDFCWNSDQQYFYCVNWRTQEVYHTDSIPYDSATAIWAADGQTFFITDENCIRAFDRKCQEIYRISCNGMIPGSLFCSGEDLFVLYGSTTIYRYRVRDGAVLNKIDVDAGKTVLFDCYWDDSQPGTLALYNQETLNLIDTQRWVVRTQVNSCLGFDLEKGLIFSSVNKLDEPLNFVYYEIYDYLDLIAMAKQQLGDITLSQEMRSKYGIS